MVRQPKYWELHKVSLPFSLGKGFGDGNWENDMHLQWIRGRVRANKMSRGGQNQRLRHPTHLLDGGPHVRAYLHAGGGTH